MLRKHWHDPGYWRWLWEHRVSGGAKGSLAVLLALIVGLGGYISAQSLVDEELAARVYTVVTIKEPGKPPKVVTLSETTTTPGKTTTLPGTTRMITVQRDGETVVIRAPGQTITNAVTVRGAVRRQVVTDMRTDTLVRTRDRFVTTPGQTITTPGRNETITTPGQTETVTREVTTPGKTETVTKTETSPPVTITSPPVTVTSPAVTVTITQTETETETETVTVTETETATETETVKKD